MYIFRISHAEDLCIYFINIAIDFCTFCGCVSIPCICAYLHLCICTLCQAVPIEESTLKIETRFSGNCVPLPNISFHWMGMYLCLLFAILVFLGWECICVFFGWECVCVFYLQYLFSLDGNVFLESFRLKCNFL